MVLRASLMVGVYVEATTFVLMIGDAKLLFVETTIVYPLAPATSLQSKAGFWFEIT